MPSRGRQCQDFLYVHKLWRWNVASTTTAFGQGALVPRYCCRSCWSEIARVDCPHEFDRWIWDGSDVEEHSLIRQKLSFARAFRVLDAQSVPKSCGEVPTGHSRSDSERGYWNHRRHGQFDLKKQKRVNFWWRHEIWNAVNRQKKTDNTRCVMSDACADNKRFATTILRQTYRRTTLLFARLDPIGDEGFLGRLGARFSFGMQHCLISYGLRRCHCVSLAEADKKKDLFL